MHEELDEKRLAVMIILVITFIGMFGNMLNMCILNRRRMSKNTTFRFLYYLSLIDLIVILMSSIDTILTFAYEYELRLYSQIACQIHAFLSYYLTHVRSVILMIVTVKQIIIITHKKFRALNHQPKFITSEVITSQIENQQQEVELSKKYETKRFVRINRVGLTIVMVCILIGIINAHHFVYMKLNSINFTEFHNNTVASQKIYFNFRSRKVNLMEHKMKFSQANSKNYLKLLNIKLADEEAITKNINMLKPDMSNQFNGNNDPVKICYPLMTSFYSYFLDTWIWIDLLIYFVMPFICMVTCASFMFFLNIRKFPMKLEENDASKFKDVLDQFIAKENNQIFKMLTIKNIFFILCSLPYTILFYKIYKGDHVNPRFSLLVHILAYVNSSVDFIFYAIFLRNYRKQLSDDLFNYNISSSNQISKSVCRRNNSNTILILENFNSTHQSFSRGRKLTIETSFGPNNEDVI